MTQPARALVPTLIFVSAVVAVISSLGAPLIPAIAAATNRSLTDAQWSLTVTLLVGAVTTPVIGKLGDGPYRRTVILVVLAAVVLGGVLAALPGELGWLITGRGLQGLGLGLMPLTIAVAQDALSAERAGSTSAVLSITVVTGVGIGFPLAGLIADMSGVYAAFWSGAGVSAVAFLAAAAVLPPPPSGLRTQRIDLVGALLLAAALAAALLVLGRGVVWGWTSPLVLALSVLSTSALTGWIAWELRSPTPLVDLRLARGRAAGTAHIGALLVGLANYLLLTSVTILAQTPSSTGYGLGVTITVSGLLFVPFSACTVIAGRLARELSIHAGPHLVLPVSALVQGSALALFTFARNDLWQLSLIMAIAGLGVGGAFAALPGLIISAVPADQAGSAMSLNQVLRYVGYAIGSTLTATVIEAAKPAEDVLPPSNAYTVIAIIGCTVCVSTAVISLLLQRGSPGPNQSSRV